MGPDYTRKIMRDFQSFDGNKVQNIQWQKWQMK